MNMLQVIISEIGNPFKRESSDLYVLDTKIVIDSEAAYKMSKLAETGKKQYRSLISRSNNAEKSRFYQPLKKNKFALLSRKTTF